jgi:hypothetical protein
MRRRLTFRKARWKSCLVKTLGLSSESDSDSGAFSPLRGVPCFFFIVAIVVFS